MRWKKSLTCDQIVIAKKHHHNHKEAPIINFIKNQLTQFFSADFLEKIARCCGFIQRARVMLPQHLVLSLLSALSKGNCRAIADLHRQFNGMSPDNKGGMAYKTFHNQLRKKSFPEFIKKVTQFAVTQFVKRVAPSLPSKLACFDHVLLQDGCSFAVHHGLAEVFPSRFQKNRAAIECHCWINIASATGY